MNIKKYIRYCTSIFLMNLLKALWIFPVKKKQIMFISYDGEQCSDNPLYLSRYFKVQSSDYIHVWALNDINQKTDNSVDHIVNRRSFKYYFYFCTSKVIVTNNNVSAYLPIRKKQILLNTWHGGGCMKRVCFGAPVVDPYQRFSMKLQNPKYTAYLSTSELMTREVFQESFHYYGKILPFGMPRNDIFFQERHNDIKEQVLSRLNLKQQDDTYDIGIILYAPTFRGSHKEGNFDIKDIRKIIQSRKIFEEAFGKRFVFLFRAHHTMQITHCDADLINVSDYPDMQELLLVADILITDYSSCSYDFSLTGKPVFLYIPDVKKYEENPGFYRNISQQPFPYGETIEDFKKAILNFDSNRYKNALQDYHKMIGCCDNGTAAQKTYEWIVSMINQ